MGDLFHFSVVPWPEKRFNNGVPSHFKTPVDGLLRHPIRLVCIWRIETGLQYCPAHSHPMAELVYHLRGTGVTTLEDGRKIAFEPHGTVLYPARMRHDQTMTAKGDDICLHISGPKTGSSSQDALSEPLYIPPLPVDPFVRNEFLQLAQVGFDPTRRLELDLRATALVVRLLHLSRPLEEEVALNPAEIHIARAREYISAKYAEIQSVKEIANHVGVSEDYLRHLFAERSGTSLIRAVTEARMDRAKELLVHSRLPLKEIASLCGFQTERYLSARFKKLTGQSPGTFRRHSFTAHGL